MGGLDAIQRPTGYRFGTSKSRVTGPSFTSSTCISARKTPVSTGSSELTQRGGKSLDQGLGVLGPGRGDPRRAPALPGVAVERELADHERRARRSRRATGSSTPSSSSKTRRPCTLAASFSASAGVSSWVTPTRMQSPRLDRADRLARRPAPTRASPAAPVPASPQPTATRRQHPSLRLCPNAVAGRSSAQTRREVGVG